MARKQSVLDIVINTIKQGDGDKNVVKGLVGIKSGLSTAVSAFAALSGAAYAVDRALDATAGKAVEYANKVESISNATGMGAEDASRTIQVLDDLRVSYDDLTASAKKNSDTDFSVEGLAKASEEYKGLATEQERQAFAQEKYGKQWVEFTKVLDAGPEKIRAMSDATSESLILTEENITQAREYQMALDAWNDSVDALAIGIGNSLLPRLTEMAVGLAHSSEIRAEANRLMQEGIAHNREEAMEMAASAVQAEAHAAAMNNNTDAMNENGLAAETLITNYGSLIGSIKDMQSETDRYKETQQEANAAIKAAEADFAAGKIDVDEKNKILAESGRMLDENAAKHKRWAAETVFSFAQAKAAADNNITEGEGQILIDMGVQLGLFDQATAETMQNVNTAFDNVDTENAQQVINALKEQMEALTNEPWVITVVTDDQTDVPTPKPAPGDPGDGLEPVRVQFANSSYISPQGDVNTSQTTTQTNTQGARSASGRAVNIYGNVTVYAQSSVISVLEELGE